MQVEIIGPIRENRTIAVGTRIRAIRRIVRLYGPGRWRNLAGVAWVRAVDGSIRLAEVHWFEAAGIGKREMKIKRYIDLAP